MAMFSCPRLHKKKHVKHVKGGNFAFFSCEAPAGELHSALGLTAQKGHGAVRMGPAEGQRMIKGLEH